MIKVPMMVSISDVSIPMDISQDVEGVDMDVGGGIVTSSNYNLLYNKPQIEGVELIGDKTFEELNLQSLTNQELEAMLRL